VEELQQKVKAKITFPPGYFISYGGTFENLDQAKKRLSVAVPVSLLLIFFLLYFAFRSVKQGLLIYSAIPLSAIGGILFLALRDMPFSISAGVGFIALFGIAVLNGIVLIAEFNRLRLSGIKNLYRIVISGTLTRLRPVLMTALVASLGFLPMALSNGAGAEVQRPLATVVIGGLLVSTFLTLFVLPILYVLFERRSKIGIKATVLIPALFLGFNMSGQTPMTLSQVIDSVLKNNLSVQHAELFTEMKKKLIAGYAEIPHTQISSEFGQINSTYSDNRFGVTQGFSFPTVYRVRKHQLTEEWKLAIAESDAGKAALRKLTSYVYNEYAVLIMKDRLLLNADSIFSSYEEIAALRNRAGESDALELASARSQRVRLATKRTLLQNEMNASAARLKLLMNSERGALPDVNFLKIEAGKGANDVSVHPEIRRSVQREKVMITGLKSEKARFLPEFSISYFNMSMIGSGADNVVYGAGTRFSSVQFGLGLPVFYGSQRSRIRASSVQHSMAVNESQQDRLRLAAERLAAERNFSDLEKNCVLMENQSLPQADFIRRAAAIKLRTGEIAYMEWSMLVLQSIEMNIEYLETLKARNEALIQLNYLNEK
jgi:cobalt-zinc-cadmium resistance protein CzcA